MYSMTGFGSGTTEINGRKLVIELKAVNHRFLDLNIKLPKVLNIYEEYIRNTMKNSLSRGHIDVFISYTTTAADDYKIDVNYNLIEKYLAEATIVSEKYNISNDVTVKTLFGYRDIVNFAENELDEQIIKSLIADTLDVAIDKLKAMRKNEGLNIKSDLLSKLTSIEAVVGIIKEYAPKQVIKHREDLIKRIEDSLGGIAVDDSKLLNEIVFYADKVATDEEFTRLFAHIEHFREIASKNEPVGRQLDFIVQEMHREANTIGSKCNEISVTNCVLTLKTDIEKIREQVQNIE